MERVVLNNVNLTPNFIGSWNLEPIELCDEIVNYFEFNTIKQKNGRTDAGLDQNIKKCVDISILPNEINLPENKIFNSYFEALFSCHKDYLLQWPYLTSFANKVLHSGSKYIITGWMDLCI